MSAFKTEMLTSLKIFNIKTKFLALLVDLNYYGTDTIFTKRKLNSSLVRGFGRALRWNVFFK